MLSGVREAVRFEMLWGLTLICGHLRGYSAVLTPFCGYLGLFLCVGLFLCGDFSVF